jgi:hypothetical protein
MGVEVDEHKVFAGHLVRIAFDKRNALRKSLRSAVELCADAVLLERRFVQRPHVADGRAAVYQHKLQPLDTLHFLEPGRLYPHPAVTTERGGGHEHRKEKRNGASEKSNRAHRQSRVWW